MSEQEKKTPPVAAAKEAPAAKESPVKRDRPAPLRRKASPGMRLYRIQLHDRDATVEAASQEEAWAQWCDSQKYWPSPRLVFGKDAIGSIEQVD